MIDVSFAYEDADIRRQMPAVPRTGDYVSLTGTALEDHHLVERVYWQFDDDGAMTVVLFIVDEQGRPAFRSDSNQRTRQDA